MSTYVLVHGAWGGSQMFKQTGADLRGRGHDVYTPSLTGIGERAHLASPQVNLTTQIMDLVNVVLYNDLTDITLLGFSYGGMVVTGSLEHIADRVAHLVYLDAFVPANGDLCWGMNDRVIGRPAHEMLENWLVPVPEMITSVMHGSPHPVACFLEPVYLERDLEEFPFSLTYVRAVRGAAPDGPFARAAAHGKSSDRWNYFEIDDTHMIPVKQPEELTRILLAVSSDLQ